MVSGAPSDNLNVQQLIGKKPVALIGFLIG